MVYCSIFGCTSLSTCFVMSNTLSWILINCHKFHHLFSVTKDGFVGDIGWNQGQLMKIQDRMLVITDFDIRTSDFQNVTLHPTSPWKYQVGILGQILTFSKCQTPPPPHAKLIFLEWTWSQDFRFPKSHLTLLLWKCKVGIFGKILISGLQILFVKWHFIPSRRPESVSLPV